ncbi:MAG TPA: diacylglycerol kinase family protein [Sphingomicrobium sp.]|nr:diacylglycerol kinase family protein [Sphingomicrobium sp.]
MRRAVTIINAGGGSVGDDAGERVRSALAAAGVDADIVVLDAGGIAERVGEAVKSGVQIVIAAGGDGTIGTVAGVLAGTSTRLGILPLGTLNHFARDLGIPADLGEAAALVASGRERSVDVAEVNGRVFINNSAIGLYPTMVLDRDAQQRRLGRSKWLALLVASVRTLARFGHQRLRLTVNGRPAPADTPLLFVGNNDYRLEFPAAGRRECLDDGKLCVLVMRSKGRAGFLAATARALLGQTRGDDMVRLDGVTTLRVETRRSVLPVALDGETNYMTPPLDYRIRPRALKVIAP